MQTYDLKSGKTKSCGCQRKYRLSEGIADITNQQFGRLTALNPTSKRDSKGSVYWHCRCDCGNEVNITEDDLVHGGYKSCGCRKREIQESIMEHLTFVDGTCVEWLNSRKTRSDNTSGFRGIYKTPTGRWKVMIGLQRKRYYLGSFDNFEDAVKARLDAEELLHNGFVTAYKEWLHKASESEKWAEMHPFYFQVIKSGGVYRVVSTSLDDEK